MMLAHHQFCQGSVKNVNIYISLFTFNIIFEVINFLFVTIFLVSPQDDSIGTIFLIGLFSKLATSVLFYFPD